MSFDAVNWAFDRPLNDPAAKSVLVALAHHANQATGICWPSIRRLMQCTGNSERTVRRALRRLEELKLIETRRRFEATSNYRILFHESELDIARYKKDASRFL